MKLSHLIIATSLTAASFATFAAPQQAPAQEDKSCGINPRNS